MSIKIYCHNIELATQFFIANQTKFRMELKTHKPHTLRWYIGKKCLLSLILPIDADHLVKYKIKTKHHLIASIFVDHWGFIRKIKNVDKKIRVETDRRHRRRMYIVNAKINFD